METRAQRRKSAAASAVQPDFKVNGNGNGHAAALSKVSPPMFLVPRCSKTTLTDRAHHMQRASSPLQDEAGVTKAPDAVASDDVFHEYEVGREMSSV